MRLDQPALVDIAGDDHRTAIAALDDAGLRIEQQLALELPGLGRMTFKTALGQDRANVRLEKLCVFFGEGRGLGRVLVGGSRGGRDQATKEERLKNA